MQITCTNLSFSYPDQATPLFDGVTFSLSDESRLGIIGPNGTGKSTLLGLLTGRLQPTSGTISRSVPTPRIALITIDEGSADLVSTNALAVRDPHLANMWELMQAEPNSDRALEAAAAFSAADGYAVVAEVQRFLARAGLPEELWHQTVASLSVGERLWLRMAEAMAGKTDLFAFDEPTSHLDIQKRAELAVTLQELDRPYVVVSHDRHFLDLVCTQILELSHGHSHLYPGGYSRYAATIQAREQHDQDVYDIQTRKVRQLKKAIGGIKGQAGNIEALAYKSSSGYFSHKAARMEKRAKAMRTQLERSLAEARAAKPFIEKKRVFAIDGIMHGGIVASLESVSAVMGGRTLFHDLSVTIRGGEHWCILGPNGAGKSTLLSILLGKRLPDAGTATVSPSVKVGFVPQQVIVAHGEDLPIDLVRSSSGLTNEAARILLGTLGIEDNQVFQPVSQLSAGQQKRAFIAQIVAGAPDLLVIDELEGNLAIDAVVQLERALSAFSGALIMVTHDVTLAQAVGEQFVTLDGKGGWSRENLFADQEQ
ncbi:MAG: ATP-binding cassette domain-containing protein [Candidatus Cryosericum sp.]